MNVYFRKDLVDIVNFVLYDDDSSSDGSDNEWSSSDDDKDVLLVDKLFPENPSLHVLIPKRNLKDISDEQCEMLFRYVNVIFLYIYSGVENFFLCLRPQKFQENVPAKCLNTK